MGGFPFYPLNTRHDIIFGCILSVIYYRDDVIKMLSQVERLVDVECHRYRLKLNPATVSIKQMCSCSIRLPVYTLTRISFGIITCQVYTKMQKLKKRK